MKQQYTYEHLDLSDTKSICEIARIHCNVPAEWEDGFECSESQVNKIASKLCVTSQGCENLVVVARNRNEELIGFHWIQLTETGLDRYGEIYSLWVSAIVRRQGVGSNLKTVAEKWLKSQGVSKVKTKVYSSNTKMIALNNKLGFTTEMVRMVKKL